MFYVTYPFNIEVHRSLYLNMFTTFTEEKALFLLINHRDGIVIERSPRKREVVGSIPDHGIPKTS